MKMFSYENLADLQLHQLIEKGKNIKEAKAAWKKKYGLDYPYVRSVNGIKKYGG